MAVNQLIKTNRTLEQRSTKTTLLDLQLKKKPLFAIPGHLTEANTYGTRAIDVSGNNRHLYIVTAAYNGDTLDGNTPSMRFNGAQTKSSWYYGDWMAVNDFTVETLFYSTESSTTTLFSIWGGVTGTYAFEFAMKYSTGGFRPWIRAQTTALSYSSYKQTADFSTNSAHHLAMTFNTTTNKITAWVDGSNSYELDTTGDLVNVKRELVFSQNYKSDFELDGRASHLAMYDRALTADEIMNHAKIAGYA